jgi:hypothetical protein
MVPLLIDEGLPGKAVAVALRAVGWDALAVGDDGAPPRESSDETNCAWCAKHGAILVTNDLGKKDKNIFDALATYEVHAVFVRNDLRGPPYLLLGALLNARGALEDYVSRPTLLRRRLTAKGHLEKR